MFKGFSNVTIGFAFPGAETFFGIAGVFAAGPSTFTLLLFFAAPQEDRTIRVTNVKKTVYRIWSNINSPGLAQSNRVLKNS